MSTPEKDEFIRAMMGLRIAADDAVKAGGLMTAQAGALSAAIQKFDAVLEQENPGFIARASEEMVKSKDFLAAMSRYLRRLLPQGWGFILLTFNFGPGGRIYYSSTAERADALATLREFLHKAETDPSGWLKHKD